VTLQKPPKIVIAPADCRAVFRTGRRCRGSSRPCRRRRWGSPSGCSSGSGSDRQYRNFCYKPTSRSTEKALKFFFYTKHEFMVGRHTFCVGRILCQTTKYKCFNFVVRQVVSSNRFCNLTGCVIWQIVLSNRLCRPTNCVVRQIVLSDRLHCPTDCVVQPKICVSCGQAFRDEPQKCRDNRVELLGQTDKLRDPKPEVIFYLAPRDLLWPLHRAEVGPREWNCLFDPLVFTKTKVCSPLWVN
jgi:hypothetical protein